MALAEQPGIIVLEGPDEELSARLESARENREFLESQYADLMAKHPKQWVAAYQQRIVAVAPTLDAMREQLQAQEIPANAVALEYFDPDDAVLVV